MRIAIPMENGTIAPQFEEAGAFKLYELEGEKLLSSVTIPAFEKGSEAQSAYLLSARADVLICGGITAQAQRRLTAAGVAIWPGMGGSADNAAAAFASGTFRPESCGHDHEHCGESSCPHHQSGGCSHCE